MHAVAIATSIDAAREKSSSLLRPFFFVRYSKTVITIAATNAVKSGMNVAFEDVPVKIPVRNIAIYEPMKDEHMPINIAIRAQSAKVLPELFFSMLDFFESFLV